jgi:RNA polymerase sigma-70 factor (ECF subfamily)
MEKEEGGRSGTFPGMDGQMKMGDEKRTRQASEEDSRIVRAFQSGDRSAFDRIVFRHKNRVFNLCHWFFGDYQEANDSAQLTFIKAFRSLNHFRFESALSTWLYRIALNTCKNRIKSTGYKQKMRSVSLDNPGQNGGEGRSLDFEDDAPSPLTRLEEMERRKIIREAIDSLQLEHREVVTLRDIQGLSYEEVAAITGVQLGTVKSRLSRARQELKERLRSVISHGL